MKVTRRKAIGILASTAALEQAAEHAANAQQIAQQNAVEHAAADAVALQWLDPTAPALASGVSWGVPFPRGIVRKSDTFRLTTADGTPLPLQTWPLAYWPDGSIKWNGFATVAGANAAGGLTLWRGPASASTRAVKVAESGAAIDIDTGALQCRIHRQGSHLIDSMSIGGTVAARDARLVCTLDSGVTFTSNIGKVTMEQTGPVRAVAKIEGVHRADTGSREWLPFIVRLYFFAGLETVRLVHTIIFDGDHEKDFIRGLGLAFSIPMREQLHNRHVRFSGHDEGVWAEPVEPLTGRRILSLPGERANVFADQLAGKRIPNRETFDARGQKLIADWATWDAYKLSQPLADGFSIQKRTNPRSCWLDAAAGQRSSGMVFAGDVSGGLAVGVKNFWQSFPASLEIEGATGSQAELRVWLWSPDAAAMDLRHYDIRAHDLDSSYEDVQPGFSTPHGVARTSELTLYPSAALPSKQDFARQAALAQQPARLVPSPRHIHSSKVFGIWSLPDRSTAAKRTIEDQLDAAFALYQREVEQRRWYGFWNFGDVMHQHDGPRHAWRYDVGGFAWDNTELGTDLWLWYSFLRTGRADIFRMAEAMTRHTSEVDTYHLGRFAMLGSRHNVRHWGCGAKESRISQAAYRRFFYYLTTDERTGDIMREVVDVDYKLLELDPMRLASPLTAPLPYPARVRGGPDWLAFLGNWMTEWERTGNAKYRDKIMAGFDSIAQMAFGFLTGPDNLYGYEPATGKLHALTPDGFGTYNLTSIMGGAEVVFELNQLIDHPGWKQAWLQYCRLTSAPKDVVTRDMSTHAEGADAAYSTAGRLAAYAYVENKNPAFAKKAWSQILGPRGPRYTTSSWKGPEVLNPIEEVTGIATNTVAQNSLHTIELLEMCGDRIE